MATLAVNLPVMLDDFRLIKVLTPLVKEEWNKLQEYMENITSQYSHSLNVGALARTCLIAPYEMYFLSMIWEIMSPKCREIISDGSYWFTYDGLERKLRELIIKVVESACRRLMEDPERLRSCLDEGAIWNAGVALKVGHHLALVAVGGGYGIGSSSWPLPEDFANIAGITHLFSEYAVDYMAEEDCPDILSARMSEYRIMASDDFMRWISPRTYGRRAFGCDE